MTDMPKTITLLLEFGKDSDAEAVDEATTQLLTDLRDTEDDSDAFGILLLIVLARPGLEPTFRLDTDHVQHPGGPFAGHRIDDQRRRQLRWNDAFGHTRVSVENRQQFPIVSVGPACRTDDKQGSNCNRHQ